MKFKSLTCQSPHSCGACSSSAVAAGTEKSTLRIASAQRRFFRRAAALSVLCWAPVLPAFLPASAAAGTSPCIAGFATYDPALRTLPEAQGFVLVTNNGIASTPTVSGGVLIQNTASNIQARQYWYSSQAQNLTSFNFSSGFTLEFNLKVITSGNTNTLTGRPRAGYEVGAEDSLGRYLSVNITSNGLWLDISGNSDPSGITPFTPFDSTGGFNTYRLMALGNTGTLFINGASFLRSDG